MLTNLRLADLRLTTAQQRSTGQNLPSDLYKSTHMHITTELQWFLADSSPLFRQMNLNGW
jgi:hypothetical protein